MNPRPEVSNVKVSKTEAKSKWDHPRFRSFEARSAELGLGTGADLIIVDTSS